MKPIAGIIASFGLLLAAPMAPAESATSCPDVDTAQAMLLKAAAAKNDQDLKQMPRKVPPGGPVQPEAPTKGKAATQPAEQDKETPPAVETAPVPEDLQRAALLVKQADDACQAGNGAEASEKAKAAMALMKR